MIKLFPRTLALVALLGGTLACSLTLPSDEPDAVVPQRQQMDGLPDIFLAAPLDGAVYLEGVPVNVLARVENAGEDIDRVEILVDNEIVTTLPQPNPAGAPVFTVAQSWPSEGLGTRQVTVNVFRADGSSTSSPTSTIQVVSDDPNAMVMAQEDTTGDGGLVGGIVGRGENDDDNEGTVEDAPEAEPQEMVEAQGDVQPAAPPQPTAPPEPTEPPTEAPSPTPSRPTATILVGANVRGGPSTGFPVIGTFAANTETEALAINPDGTWYKVQYYNAEGWIFNDLVSVSGADELPTDAGPPTPTPIPPTPTPIPVTDTPVPRQVNIRFDGATAIEPYPPECGETMSIRVPVQNDGSESMGETAALLVRDTHIDSGATTEINAPIPDLGPGESRTVEDIFLTVDTNFDSRHRIEVILDSGNDIQETNEGDNASRADALEYTLERGSC